MPNSVTADHQPHPALARAAPRAPGRRRSNNSDPDTATDDIVHVTPSQIGAAPGDTLFAPGGYVSFAGVSNVTLNTGSGNDAIYLRPSALTEFTVDASYPLRS